MAGLLSYLPDDIGSAPRAPRVRKKNSKGVIRDSSDEEGEEDDYVETPMAVPEGNAHLLHPKSIRTYSSPGYLNHSQPPTSPSNGSEQQQPNQKYVPYSPAFAPLELNKRKSGSSMRLRDPDEMPQLHDDEVTQHGKGENSSSSTAKEDNSKGKGPSTGHVGFEPTIHRPHPGALQLPPLLNTSIGEPIDWGEYSSTELSGANRESKSFGNRHSSIIGPSSTSAAPDDKTAAPRRSLDYSTGEDTETPTLSRRSFFAKLKSIGHTPHHGRNMSGWTVDSEDEAMQTPQPVLEGDGDDSNSDSKARRRSFSPGNERESRTAPTTPRSGVRRRATMTDIPEGDERRRPSSSHANFGRGPPSGRRFPGFDYFRQSQQDVDAQSPGGAGESSSFAKWRALKASMKLMGRSKKEESKVDREKSAELMAELAAGTPAVAMLASMFQRDEHGNKRIPVLLEQLKVKITDSKPPSKGASRYHAIFKIDLEYGSGLTRMQWTIHREFRDFVNIHSRYRLADISNTTFGGRGDYKLPKFPRATIPYLRGVRGLGSDDEDADAEHSAPEDSRSPDTPRTMNMGALTPGTPEPAPPITAISTQRDVQQQLLAFSPPPQPPAVSHKSRIPFLRKTTGPQTPDGHGMDITTGVAAAGIGTLVGAIGGGSSTLAPLASRRDTFAIRQRQKLEQYLQGLIRIMIFRPDSNRLCKFLELSALGVRLAAENSYHGKEGYLIIRSAKGSDFRKGWTPSAVAHRHRPKWFLVRHSYIVCVDSPEEMNIYDVFLVDHMFEVDAKKFLSMSREPKPAGSSSAAHPQHHSLRIRNSERQLKLLAKHERQLQQFYESITFMKEASPWSKQHRLGSFAPVRKNVFAQWLVDGRDYMWNVSRAISMAKDVIYIHDWWLSPELYLRRPAAVSQKWRLDRLLQKKATEGVKIFVIVYRNIGAAVPIDSSYTKYSLLDLHPNVFVQRSPNQIRQNTFFWAHHEKILVVDHMVAFVGGIDLCFGRWDTPQHSLRDDRPTGFEDNLANKDPDSFQLWPGKDYSNPRVQDFYSLDKPYEEMYDRAKVARMPWHDISMQLVGQPARDLTRHFVQRWNYLLRQRTPSRPTPILLPPPDFTEDELSSLGIDGTCEIQILRSSCAWSMGTPNLVEHSIMNAYLKAIETSDHFVYIENQFFITSCEWEGTKIENSIGDALVERIIRAHKNDEDWRAVILIPLMPGFQNTVDSQDGTSIRLIMQCQYRSISRGDSSIFGRLRAQGIDPDDFIQFYGLRNWGKIGPDDALVTEQLYIHAKCMVVDDRIVIIGSANINERSMLGNRDSEVAAIVRDTDTIMSTMAGQPYRVGKFAHSLRLRLMREHLGMDVDEIMAEERKAEMEAWEKEMDEWSESVGHDGAPPPNPPADARPTTSSTGGHSENAHPDSHDPDTPRAGKFNLPTPKRDEAVMRAEELLSFNHDVDWEQENSPYTKSRKKESHDNRITGNLQHKEDIIGAGVDNMKKKEEEKKKLKDKTRFYRRKSRTEQLDKGKGREESGFTRNSLPPWEARSTLGSPVSPPTTSSTSGGRSRADTATTTSSNLTDAASEKSGYDGLPPHPAQVQGRRGSSVEHPLPSHLPPLPKTSDFDIGGPVLHRPSTSSNKDFFPELSTPVVDPDMFIDPLNDAFFMDVWHQCAQNNTKIFRDVFRCMPDNEVRTWKEYKEYVAYQEKFSASQGMNQKYTRPQAKGGPPGTSSSNMPPPMFNSISETLNEKSSGGHLNVPGGGDQGAGSVRDTATPTSQDGDKPPRTANDSIPQIVGDTNQGWSGYVGRDNSFTETTKPGSPNSQESSSTQLPVSRGTNDGRTDAQKNDGRPFSASTATTFNNNNLTQVDTMGQPSGLSVQPSVRRRRRNTRSSRREFHANDEILEKEVAEAMLEKVQGHLVIWPHDWLKKAEDAGNWLYSIDQLAPIEIYN
ncbi:hypothetical protein DFH27DRAFT_42727 [Peziza echinospora]|nr:hypothetical protein DFH27DRAFT_42727 [Peziza echinospora]